MNEGGRSNLMVGGESSRALEVLECLADLGVAAEPLCTKALPGAGHHTPGRSLLDWIFYTYIALLTILFWSTVLQYCFYILQEQFSAH